VLPTFLVIGAMKAGTTSLGEYLGVHPEIFVTAEKEPHFFSFRDRQALGLEWYESLFDRADGAIARGEASTTYTKYPRFPGTPARIAQVVPDVRLIYVVRQPVDRIRSQYLHEVSRGQQVRPLAEVLRERPTYVDTSRYGLQLDQYLEHFPAGQLLVLTADQLRHDRQATMARVFGFLGVDPAAAQGALHREHHRTSDRTAPRPFDRLLESVPGRRLAGRLAPAPLTTAYQRFSRRPLTDFRAAAELPPAVENFLKAELQGDVARLRDFLGDGFDGWGIA